MRRGSPQSTLGWLAGLTASFVLASLFSIAPAAAESCCTLVFTVQPADNVVNPVPNIDGSAFDGSGPSVTVAAVNSSNNVNPSFRGLVTLVTTINSSGATLSGNRVRAVNGVAVFPNLAVDRPGRVVLQAQSPDIASSGWPYSNPFRIVNDFCEANDTCSGSYAPNGTRLLDASFPNSTTDPAVLLVGGDLPYPPTGDISRGCSTDGFVDPFYHAAAVSTTEQAYQGGGTVMLTLRIDKAWRKIVEARGNPNYRICGAVPLGTDIQHTWNDSPTSVVGDQLVFLFPDCTSTIRVFCMVSVNSNGGAIIETAITKTGGDPRHW
jgi:hypothetical protein